MPVFTEEQWLGWFDRLATVDYCVIDNFLSASSYEQVWHFFKQKLDEDALGHAGIGTMQDYRVVRSVRGDRLFWLEEGRDQELNQLYLLLSETKQMLNKHCFLSLSGYEFHLTHYRPGSHYERHLDQFNDRNNRIISMVVYLNRNWQPGNGGELRLFLPDGELDIEPSARRCVLFRSDVVEHEVMRTITDRYSITGWFLYQPTGLGFL